MNNSQDLSSEYFQNLRNLLRDFTFNVIADKPGDLISYGIQYFTNLKRQKHVAASGSHTYQEKTDSYQEKADSDQEKTESDLEKTDSDESNPDSQRDIVVKLGSRCGRRDSVSAEKYDPSRDALTDIKKHDKTSEQSSRIQNVLGEIFLFRGMDENDVNTVIGAMKQMKVSEGDIIIQQGDKGDSFYVVDKGVFNVLINDADGKDQVVRVYKDSGGFGELALMYNEPRAATVVAATDGLLWCMDGRDFRRLIVKGAYEKRRRYDKLLKSVPELRPLSEHERGIVSDALLPQLFRENEVICRQGDIGDGMYFIESGAVSVSTQQQDSITNLLEEHEIGRIHPGGYFGELSLISREPRAATVIALKDTKVAFLDTEAVERLLGPCMDLLKQRIAGYDSPHHS